MILAHRANGRARRAVRSVHRTRPIVGVATCRVDGAGTLVRRGGDGGVRLCGTRRGAVRTGLFEHAGRWWWDADECLLHAGEVVTMEVGRCGGCGQWSALRPGRLRVLMCHLRGMV